MPLLPVLSAAATAGWQNNNFGMLAGGAFGPKLEVSRKSRHSTRATSAHVAYVLELGLSPGNRLVLQEVSVVELRISLHPRPVGNRPSCQHCLIQKQTCVDLLLELVNAIQGRGMTWSIARLRRSLS